MSAIFAFVLILAAAVQPATAANYSTAEEEEFYRELVRLLGSRDESGYFDKMELQIGRSSLQIDGETQALDVAPEIANGRTMLPIRAIAEAAGATVTWDPETSTVIITSAYGDVIRCTIGADYITINNETSEIDTSAYVENGRTYLPLRAVAEALELEVEWESEDARVTLTAPYQSARVLILSDHPNLNGLTPESTLNDGNGLWVIQFATPAEAKMAVELLQSRGIMAEPDYYIPPINDEAAYTQTSQSGSHKSWGASDCGFDAFVSKNAGLFKNRGIVAVVDTGVDASHPFFNGRVMSGYDFVDGGNGTADGNSHGTHVAGTIIDCVGTAPVSILPLRVLDNQGSGTNVKVVAGINYAAEHGANVINLSLGGGHSEIIDQAVSNAISKGCVVVAAAGNDNEDTSNECPAHIITGGTIIVSAGDSHHNKAGFSNYGKSVDLMAPGVSINATVPGGGYATKSGTSMATPHAAAATVLIDLAWGASLSPAEVEAKVRTATTYGKWTNQTVGCGFLDMSKAATPQSTVTPSVNLSKHSLALTVGNYEALSASVAPTDAKVSWSSSNTAVATVNGNGTVTAVGSGTASVTASISVDGKTYSDTCTVTVSAPGIRLSQKSLSLTVGESATLTATTVPAGQSVTWKSSDSNVAAVNNGQIKAMSAGTAEVTASITYSGKTYSDSCIVSVQSGSDNPPVNTDWTTEKLPEIPGYRIETKLQYRYRVKETTTSTNSSLAGWTLYDQRSDYSEWGETRQTTSQPTASDTLRIVGTSQEYDYTVYTYYHWWGYGSKDGKLYNHPAAGFYQNYESFTTTEPLTCSGYSSYQSVPLYKKHIDGAHGENWYLEKQEDVYHTVWEYQTRTLTTVYCYYRWGEWSAWQDTAVSNSANVDMIEVEMRTLYRYQPA